MDADHMRRRALEELALLAEYYQENEVINLDFVYVHTLTLLEHLDAMTLARKIGDAAEADRERGAA